MTKKTAYHGLILPTEDPPKITSLKRQLLFFDLISIASPDDKALINEGEIVEEFPGMSIRWSNYALYPLSNDYRDRYRYLLEDSQILIKRGLLRVLPVHEKTIDDAGNNFRIYNSAITEKNLLLQAIPDRTNGEIPVTIPDGMLAGGGIKKSGCKSKFELPVNSPCELDGVSNDWSALAYLRVGRTLKYMRRANLNGCFSIATDMVSHNICNTLSSTENYISNTTPPNIEEVSNYSISLDVVDIEELEKALSQMSWDDVIKLRREILPKVAVFRNHIVKKLRPLRKGYITQDDASKVILGIRSEFEILQEDLAAEWEKIRIATVVRGGGSAGGISLIPSLTGTWEEILIRVIAGGLVAASIISPRIESLIPASRKLRSHPLYFSTMLPK